MPHPLSNNSAVTKQEDRENKNHLQEVKSTNAQPQADTTVGDLHYATEELLDGLPKLWTKGVLYALVGFVLLGLPWATISKIDETGTARGRIQPKGATRTLDTKAGGSV